MTLSTPQTKPLATERSISAAGVATRPSVPIGRDGSGSTSQASGFPGSFFFVGGVKRVWQTVKAWLIDRGFRGFPGLLGRRGRSQPNACQPDSPQLSSLQSGSLQPGPLQPGSSVRSNVAPWLTRLIYPLGQYVVLPGFFRSITVIGREHLPASGPVVVTPTHRSRWDALLVPYAIGPYVTGRDLRFMVSANEVRGIQGWFIRRLGGFAIDPKRPSPAVVRHSVDLLAAREILTIFPEGDIFRDGTIHPLKPGAARFALQAEQSHPGLGTQIIPIHLQYDRPYPTWRSTVTIRIGPPIQVSSYTDEPLKTAVRSLSADLLAALQALEPTGPDLS